MKKILFGITMILCLAGCANVTEEVPPVVDTSTCTVTFDSNGGTGSVPESQSVQKYLSIDVATENKTSLKKDGYVFQGWSTTGEADSQVAKCQIASYTVLKAVWDPVFDTVEHTGGSGNIIGSRAASGSGVDIKVRDVYKSGGAKAENLTGELIVPSIINGCNVANLLENAINGLEHITSIIINDGINCFEKNAIAECNSLTLVIINGRCTVFNEGSISLPTAAKISFTNTATRSNALKANPSLEANCSKVSVKYFDGETELTDLAESIYINASYTVSSSAPAKEGLAFTYWYTGTSESEGTTYKAGDEITSLTADLTLYAKYLTARTIKYYDGEKELSDLTSVVADGNDYTTSAAPEKTDFTFAYWYTGTADNITASYDSGTTISNVQADINLYARYVDSTETLLILKNGDKVVEKRIVNYSPINSYSISDTEKSLGVTKANFKFTGWAKEDNGSSTKMEISSSGEGVHIETAYMCWVFDWTVLNGKTYVYYHYMYVNNVAVKDASIYNPHQKYEFDVTDGVITITGYTITDDNYSIWSHVSNITVSNPPPYTGNKLYCFNDSSWLLFSEITGYEYNDEFKTLSIEPKKYLKKYSVSDDLKTISFSYGKSEYPKNNGIADKEAADAIEMPLVFTQF